MKPNRMNHLNSRSVGIALTVILVTVCCPAARADWVGDTSSDWNDALNWPDDILPATNSGVAIQSADGNIATISADSTFSPGEIVIGGWWATGRLDHTAGTADTATAGWPPGWMLVGFGEQGNATYNLANTAMTGGALTGYGTGSGTMNLIHSLYLGEPGGNGNGNGVATVNVNTSGALNIAGDLLLGVHGWTGTVNVDQGTVTANTVAIGKAVANVGWGNQTYTIPALAPIGTLKVSGGSVTSNFRIDVGSGSGSDPGAGGIGVVTLSGGTLAANGVNPWEAGVRLGAGILFNFFDIRTPQDGGTGTFNLDGGELSTRFVFSEDETYTSDNGTPEVPEDDVTITATRGTSVFNFNGGTLKPIQNLNDSWDPFMRGLTRANVRNGGAVVDTSGFNVRIDQALDHSDIEGDNAKDGGLTKNGAGSLNLFGANTYTGNTTVNEGTLSMSNPSLDDASTVTVVSGATLDLNTGGATDIVGSLVLGSLTMPDGTYGAGHESGLITGSGFIQVGAAASGYSAWAGNVNGETADLDANSDGVDNGIAYFMNNTGVISLPGIVGGAVTWTNGGNIAAAQYGTQFVVQTSPDLVTWINVESGDPNLSNTSGSVTYAITGAGSQFVRLKVTPN